MYAMGDPVSSHRLQNFLNTQGSFPFPISSRFLVPSRGPYSAFVASTPPRDLVENRSSQSGFFFSPHHAHVRYAARRFRPDPRPDLFSFPRFSVLFFTANGSKNSSGEQNALGISNSPELSAKKNDVLLSIYILRRSIYQNPSISLVRFKLVIVNRRIVES